MDYEDRVTIITPEGLSMDVTLAGLGSRILAAILDALIQAVLFGALFIILSVAGPTGAPEPSFVILAAVNVAAFLVLFFYHALFERFQGGQTPGKRATGLRVVHLGGGPIGFKAAAIRNLLRIVDVLPILYTVGIVSILVSSRNQRLGDLLAGTIVIRSPKPARRRSRRRRDLASQQPRAFSESELAALDVSGLTQDDLATIRLFLERRQGLEPKARTHLAEDLADRLRPKVPGAPPDSAEKFLEKLAAAKAARA